MDHAGALVLTLAGALTAALVLGYLTHRLRLSPIVGYLLAGIAVGPFTPGLVVDAGTANQLASFGVVLLLFGVGLEFHVREMLRVWRVAVPGALALMAAVTVLGWMVARAEGIGGGWMFGLTLSITSTVVLTRILGDRGELRAPAGQLAIGWLVLEDLFTVLLLVIVPPSRAGKRARSSNASGSRCSAWAACSRSS